MTTVWWKHEQLRCPFAGTDLSAYPETSVVSRSNRDDGDYCSDHVVVHV